MLRNLSRVELKALANHLAGGSEKVLQDAVAAVTARNPKTAGATDDSPAARHDNDAIRTEQTTAKANATTRDEEKTIKVKKAPREFDMGLFSQRHIALHVAYFGEDYRGFASQDGYDDTIEFHLFRALEKACLIKDRKSAQYSRCGRTDAGVSALGQILTLTVRSNLSHPQPSDSWVPPEKKQGEQQPVRKKSKTEELDYPHILNRLLPNDIMILGWCPAPSLDYQARFNAETRTYRYYFMARQLDLDAMSKAGKLLQGKHDFRNLCKMDVMNVNNFVREIKMVEIVRTDNNDMCYIKVQGNAFLWHQIRCIASILFMVGQKKEQPCLVSQLLDISPDESLNQGKPAYDMAAGDPLILFESEYPSADLEFRYEESTLVRLRQKLEYRIAIHEIRSNMTKGVVQALDKLVCKSTNAPLKNPELVQGDFMPRSKGSPKHVPLMQRPKCDSFQTRVDSLSEKKRKIRQDVHGWV